MNHVAAFAEFEARTEACPDCQPKGTITGLCVRHHRLWRWFLRHLDAA